MWIPRGAILAPLLFPVYIDDVLQVVQSKLFLYADDSCLVFQEKDVTEFEKLLNGDFTDICK